MIELAKKQLGLAEKGPAFIGTANLAQYWWCAEKSLLKGIEMEETFFELYLLDRVSYAAKLGRVASVPSSAEDLLALGADITLADVNRLLAERGKRSGSDYRSEAETSSPDVVQHLVDEHLMPSEGTPISRGIAAEQIYAKNYPTIRWNRRVGDLVVIGQPDGITDDFVYEFKSTRMGGVARRLAEAQANFYGAMFARKEKVVEILHLPANKLESKRSAVDTTELDRTYTRAGPVYAGTSAPIPPQPWKCRPCEYRTSCPVTPLRPGL